MICTKINICVRPTERNIRALMVFESFTTTYTVATHHGLPRAFDRMSANPMSQKLQPPPPRCMGEKACQKR